MALIFRVCLVWPYVATYGLVSFYGHRHVWPCVVLYGLFMALYGILWSFMA